MKKKEETNRTKKVMKRYKKRGNVPLRYIIQRGIPCILECRSYTGIQCTEATQVNELKEHQSTNQPVKTCTHVVFQVAPKTVLGHHQLIGKVELISDDLEDEHVEGRLRNHHP